MWGNLAGRLGANDLNSTLQKIGNAVAPPPGDDEYDDDDFDEEYDDEYDDYEDEDGDDDEGNEEGRGGLGLVGLIARALDDNNEGSIAEDKNDFDEAIEGENDESQEPVNVAVSHATTKESDGEGHSRQTTSLPTMIKTTEDPTKDFGSGISTNDGSYMQSEIIATEDVDNDFKGGDDLSKVIDKPVIPAQHMESIQVKTTLAPAGDGAATPVPQSNKEANHLTIAGVGDADAPVTKTRKEADHLTPGALDDTATVTKANKETTNFTYGASKADLKDLPQYKISSTDHEHQSYSDNATNTGLVIHTTASASNGERGAGKSMYALSQTNGKSDQSDFISPSTSRVINAATEEIEHQQNETNGHYSSFELTSGDSVERLSVQSGMVSNEEKHDGLIEENQKLLEELKKAQNEIAQLQTRASRYDKEASESKEQLMVAFQEKEARLLQATTEEHRQEMMRIEQARQLEIRSLNAQIAKDRTQLLTQQAKYKAMIEEGEARAERAEANLVNTQQAHEKQLLQYQKKEERSIRSAEDKVAHTLALLDERNGQIADLKKLVRDLESKMTKHQEGEEEAEAEADELQDHVDELEHECEELKLRVSQLEEEAEKYSRMQMELTALREERERERMHNQSAVESAIQSNTRIETERDEAISELRDMKIQLAASIADLKIARADVQRMTVANGNLSDALEAFQDERRAELELLEQQRYEAEKALASSHDAAVAALREAHKREVEKVQDVGNAAVRHKMDELSALETQLDRLKSENTQMRRSLDEAIYRLQTSQEDVIDRTLMKNILLDWCTMKDKGKRQQVLELMANVLHFNDDERNKVHLTHMDIESVRSRVVGAIAAPLPPSKADVDALEGTNVREKFLSFMLAETEEGS